MVDRQGSIKWINVCVTDETVLCGKIINISDDMRSRASFFDKLDIEAFLAF